MAIDQQVVLVAGQTLYFLKMHQNLVLLEDELFEGHLKEVKF